MNLKRVLSALIGLPIVAAILILGNKYVIDVLFAVVAVISIYEYFNAIKKEYTPVKILGYILATSIAFIHVIPTEILTKYAIMIIPTSIAILFISVIVTSMKIKPRDIFAVFFGMCYVIGFIAFLPMLYGSENGKILIWYILIAAWGTDTFAYAVGRRIGKHKLTPISPKKSVEGSIGGTIGAVVITLIYTVIVQKYINLNISYLWIAVISAILSILSQIGDLSASAIKREMDVKDYGNLIPGHGGMLDRIDSIIFIAPFAYFLFTMI